MPVNPFVVPLHPRLVDPYEARKIRSSARARVTRANQPIPNQILAPAGGSWRYKSRGRRKPDLAARHH
eukprot:7296806-Prymnesium_polylepis.1